MTNDPHIQSGRDTIQAGRDVIQVGGDYVGGDKITNIYQQLLRPVPFAFRAGVQRMVEDYTAIFGGRDAELARLDTFLTADERPFGLLIAPTGRGKTALLIHWLARVQQQHADWRVVFAPISIRYQTASEQVALNLLAHTLAEAHNDLEQFRSYDQSPASLRALVGDYLRRPLPDGVRLLVVLDGLDEATGWQVSRELFPRSPGSNLKIVVAARDMAHRTRATWYRELGFERRLTCDLELEGLSQAAVRDLLQRMGNPLDQLATDVDVLAEIERVSQGDPVTIRLLVELLQAEEIKPGQLANVPADDLNAVLDLWLEHLREHERQHERVYALLSLTATAYGPLTTADVVKLDGTQLGEQRDVEDAARAVARFVIGNGTPEQGYVFSHQRLREVYREQRLSAAQQAAVQQRFVQYGEAWYKDRSQPLPDYLRQFWVTHLKVAEEWETLRQVLTEIVPVGESVRSIQPWADARYRAEGSYAGYLSNLDVLWQWADAQQDIALGVRCALIFASIRSLSGNLTPELLVGLVTVGTPDGKWSTAAALEHIRQMPDSRRQAECIEALVEAGCELPWDLVLEVGAATAVLTTLAPHLPLALLPDALAAARAIPDEDYRVQALIAIALHLPPDQQPAVWHDALTAVNAIVDHGIGSRARVLTTLAPLISPTLLPAALAAANAIRSEDYRVQALIALVPHLPPDQQPAVWHNALTAANAIRSEDDRARALEDLVPHLPPAFLPAALEVAQAIADDWQGSRARALIALAPHLPPDQQPAVWHNALAAANAIRSEDERARALGDLAPHLPALLPDVLAAAKAIEAVDARANALTALVPLMPHAQQEAVCRDALTAAHAVWTEKSYAKFDWFFGYNSKNRARTLIALVPHLPPDLLPNAIAIVQSIGHMGSRADVLIALVPHLPPDLLPNAIAAAHAIRSEDDRARTLIALASRLPPDQQTAALFNALDAAHAIRDKQRRDRALSTIAPLLPLDQQMKVWSEALDAAHAIGDKQSRAFALIALAPHLPLDLLSEALATTLTIDNAARRIRALSSLGHHLPYEQKVEVARNVPATTHTIYDEKFRIESLIELAPHLPPNLLSEALEAAETIDTEYARVNALIKLAPHLPRDLLAAALDIAQAIQNEQSRARALRALASHLPPALLFYALDIAQAIQDEQSRAFALIKLAPRLAPDQQPAVWNDALAAACAIANENFRAVALRALAPHLPFALISIAFDTARTIANANKRARILIALAPRLPRDLLAAAFRDVFDAAHTVNEIYDRDYVLQRIAPLLPPDLLAAALGIAQAIQNEQSRARDLITLAPHLPTDLLGDALSAARALDDEENRARALTALAPLLPPNQQTAALRNALDATHAIRDKQRRDRALSTIAPLLPPDQQLKAWSEVLDAAHAISYEKDRAKALSTLAPRLPPDRTLFYKTLPILAAHGRPDLLSDLAALTPWLEALATPDELADIAQSIVDVSRCWP